MGFKKGDICKQVMHLNSDESEIVIIIGTRNADRNIGHRHIGSKRTMFAPEGSFEKIDMTQEEFEQMEVENEI